mgnify:CR=1 FL=1
MEKFVCLLLSTNKNFLLESSLFLDIHNFIGTEYDQLKLYLTDERISQAFRNLCLEFYKKLHKQYKLKFNIEDENRVKINYSYKNIFGVTNDVELKLFYRNVSVWRPGWRFSCDYKRKNFLTSDNGGYSSSCWNLSKSPLRNLLNILIGYGLI